METTSSPKGLRCAGFTDERGEGLPPSREASADRHRLGDGGHPCRTLLVALFVLAIALPPAANLAGFDGADPGAENRELAAFPRVDGSWASIAAFPTGLIVWFDDHFGFRSVLVRWYGGSRLFGLGVSPSAAVVEGRDGWFFYGDDKAIEDYADVDPMTPEALANWRAAVKRAHDWLQARGIAYVFTIAPDKHIIYAEHMPATIARVGEVSRADQLFTALQDTGLAVDVRPSLFEARGRERIYHRTDTHWNDRGALAAYQRIIGAVGARAPATPPASMRTTSSPSIARSKDWISPG